MDAVEVLTGLGGCATWGALVARCGNRDVRRALAEGRVRRISRGVYALPASLSAVATARSHRGVLSHESAALHWGFSVLNKPDHPHVTIPRNRRRRPSREPVTLHWADAPAIDDVTTPVRTVLDCARTLPLGEALVVADSALRTRLVDREELLTAGRRIRRAGRARVVHVAELADGRSESALESMLRAVLIAAGLDMFVPQVLVEDDGFSARVDLADPVRRLVIEADSFEFHGTRKALARDSRRYVSLVVRGWTVLRFSWEDVMHDPDWVVESVRAWLGVQTRGQNSLPRAA
jgi:very-short-patch-repair endonuclease